MYIMSSINMCVRNKPITLCMPILHHKCKILLYVKYFISCSFLLVSGLWDNTKTKLKCTWSCFRLKETDPTLPLNYVFITSATLHFSSAMKRLITLWNMITIMSLYRVLFHKQHNHPSAKILCSLLKTNQKNVISSPVQAVSGVSNKATRGQNQTRKYCRVFTECS